MRRWMDGGVFEVLVADVQSLLREFGNRKRQRTAVYLVTHPLESTPASGVRAGSDGAKRLKNSKVQIAVDRLGHLMAQKATPADRGDRAQVIALAEEVQLVTGDTIDLACVHRGCTGQAAREAAVEPVVRIEVVKQTMAILGFVLQPRRWVVELSFA
jgi:hypothetical protein